MVVGSLVTYATVKAYSLKGKLLSKKTFQTLAESRNLDEFASCLTILLTLIIFGKFQNLTLQIMLRLVLGENKLNCIIWWWIL